VRNSSLVKRYCAENSTGLKAYTEAAAFQQKLKGVGERSLWAEAKLKSDVDYKEVRMPV
jgi:hypothetical protein